MPSPIVPSEQGGGAESPRPSATSTVQVSPSISMGGWMERKVGKVGLTKRWKRHYFGMEPTCLVEYFDIQGGGSSKFYPFSQISDILIEDRAKFIFSFRFHKKPNDMVHVKVILFRLATSEELHEWVSKLRIAVMQQSSSSSANNAVLGSPQTAHETAHKFSVDARKSMDLKEGVESPVLGALSRSRATSEIQQQQQPLSPRFGEDEDNTAASDEEEEEEVTSNSESDSDTENFHQFLPDATLAAAPSASQWGQRVKRFLSRSAWDEDEQQQPQQQQQQAQSPAVSFAQAAVDVPPMRYDLRTLRFVEYDLVEVFENQRWFPLSGWTAKKSLLSDRAHYTSRHGHNRTSLFREGSDANEATAGNEDRHEIPGTQVHVIKEPWQWDSPQWQLQPLIGMQRSVSKKAHQHPPGRRLSLGGGSDAEGGDNTSSAKYASILSEDGALPGIGAAAGTLTAAPPTSTGKSPWIKTFANRRSTGVLNSKTSAQPQTPGGGSGSGSMNSQLNSAQSAPILTNALVSASSELITDVHKQSDSTWSLGFDFTDFDHAIARGVPKTNPPLMASNVRTRRWVRLRKRIVNITARLPESDELALKLYPSLVSYQRQVVCEGWLGTNIRRVWKSRYLKLVRIFEGSWDDGEGRGLVKRAPVAIQLICYECKERCNVNFEGIAVFTLEPNSVARLAVSNLDKAVDAEMEAQCFTLNKNRFGVESAQTTPLAESGANNSSIVLDGSEESSFQLMSALEERKSRAATAPRIFSAMTNSAPEKPRSGRFEFVLNRDKGLIFSADSSQDSIVWVKCLNAAAAELQAMAASSSSLATSALPLLAPDAPAAANKAKKTLFGLVKNIRHHRHVMESDSDVEETGAGTAVLANTSIEVDELVAMPTPPPPLEPSTFSSQGKLKEWEDFELKCSIPVFFTLFYGDRAKYGMRDMHAEMGDFDFQGGNWAVPAAGESKFAKDEYDFEGCEHAPERLLQFQSYTKSPVGASVTRVEKLQRYYFYAQDHALFLTSTTRSLDVPFGDSFAVYERWIVTSDAADLNKVRVRIYLEAIFSKPAGFIGATIKRLIHVQIPKNYLQWKKRAFPVLRALSTGSSGAGDKASDAAAETDAPASAAAGKEAGESKLKMLVPAFEAIWQERVAIVKMLCLAYLIWWMHAALLILTRLVEALERKV